MKKKTKHTLTPKLRFPEFRDKPGWEQSPLGVLTDPITERVGDSDCVPYTVTSGEGLISQEDKYGRTIAGQSLKNYYRLKHDDFAFNKSATKSFPQGYIARFQGGERAAVPNSIFTCFRIANENVDAAYLDYLFQGNLHGRWLKDYITVGARAHGALNISDDDLYAMPIPLPAGDTTKAEQQKVAECLGSLDGLIAAEGWKLAALRDHKRGLMQQLFPQPGQTQPRLRFPEFRDKGEWKEKRFGRHLKINSGKGFKASEYSNNGIRLLQIENVGYGKIKWNENIVYLPQNYTEDYPELVLRAGDIVLALNRPITNNELKIAKLVINDALSILYQRVGRIEKISDSITDDFVFHICHKFIKEFVIKQSIGSDQPFISLRELYKQSISIPSPSEQEKIAACLTSLDTQIAAQALKIETLKQHKRGLMQQLFPSPQEVEA